MTVYNIARITHSRHINPLPDDSRKKLTEKNHPYVHGTGFGLGVEVIADPLWGKLLKKFEPDLYNRCNEVLDNNNRVLNYKTANKINLLMENSPILAAYCRFKIGSSFIPEIDIWLNPDSIDMNKCKICHGNLLTTILSKLPYFSQKAQYFIKKAYSVQLWFNKYDAALLKINEKLKVSSLDSKRFQAVCLDIKSPWSSANDIYNFVNAFQQNFNEVIRFVGTFDLHQIKDLPIPGILFFHSVSDIEQASKKGLPKNIGFNGADLLSINDGTVEVKTQILNRLRLIHNKNPNTNVMIYVQENNCGDTASKKLIELVYYNPDLFKLGFALGLDRTGLIPRMIEGNGCGCQKLLMTDSWFVKFIRLIQKIFFLFFKKKQ